MEMIRVNSSAIHAVGYDAESGRMTIRFTSGKVYDFCGVPQHVYASLMSAASKGTYFNAYIKDRYEC
jgi:hypothetical protein